MHRINVATFTGFVIEEFIVFLCPGLIWNNFDEKRLDVFDGDSLNYPQIYSCTLRRKTLFFKIKNSFFCLNLSELQISSFLKLLWQAAAKNTFVQSYFSTKECFFFHLVYFTNLVTNLMIFIDSLKNLKGKQIFQVFI